MRLFLLVVVYITLITAKRLIYYADFEHPNVTYWNPKHYEYVRITAQRYSRRDPVHYMNTHVKSLTVFGNDVKVDVYGYEFLSNEYRRSMLEVHFKLCDIYFDTKFDVFKPIYMKYANASSCPFPKGEYHYMNISYQDMPLLATFPYRKGRGFLKVYFESTGERLMEAHIDGVIKERFI